MEFKKKKEPFVFQKGKMGYNNLEK